MMRADVDTNDFQSRVLHAYTVLCLLREDWAGALIVCRGLDAQGAAVAMAANIAGAVCLGIEESPEILKAAGRVGACDFLVNTLDEALRAMKNEVRKRKPISVGLLGNPHAVVRELVERGVQPELFIDLAADLVKDLAAAPLSEAQLAVMDDHRRAKVQWHDQGALLLDFSPSLPGMHVEGTVDAQFTLNAFLRERQWELHVFSVANAAALQTFEDEAVSLFDPDDSVRRRWLRRASSIVQRQRPLRRALWVDPREKLLLASLTL